MFEHSLIDLESKQQPARRRWISLPVAVSLHLVAFAAFGFGSYWSVGDVAEPPVNVAFIDVMLPPPPPPIKRGGGKPPEPTKSQAPSKPLPPQQPVQPDPTRVPDKLPAAQDTTEDFSAPGTDPTAPVGPGDPNGDPLGDPNGSKDGVPDGEAPPVEGPTGPVHLTAAMTPPVALFRVPPRYTETARRANIQGVVVVEAIVDEQGRVTDARVLRGLPMGLDRSAIEAIQQWKFRPAMMQGRPVKVYFTLTATFTLQH